MDDQGPTAGPPPAPPTPPTPPSPPTPPVPAGRVPLPPSIGGWMVFVAIMTILGGALNVLSCIGLPWGVLMIVAGVALYGARNDLLSIRSVDPALEPFFRRLKTYMLMTGIVFVLSILIFVVVVVVYFGVIVAALASAEL